MDPCINRVHSPTAGLLAGLAIVAVAVSLSTYLGDDAQALQVNTSSISGSQRASRNWDFEKGDLTRWHTRARGSGRWQVYADGSTPPDPTDTDPNVPFAVPQPPQGRYAAITDMSAPGSRIMYRDVKLDGRVGLRFTLFYRNASEGFASPASLDFDGRRANQQFRVDLVDPAAPVTSLAAKHVLATIYQTVPGDPARLDPRTITFDLSRWAARTVRIRFVQIDNRGPLRAGVDDVRLLARGS